MHDMRVYLVKRLNKAAVVAKCRHYEHVVLLVYIKYRLYIDLGILRTTTNAGHVISNNRFTINKQPIVSQSNRMNHYSVCLHQKSSLF